MQGRSRRGPRGEGEGGCRMMRGAPVEVKARERGRAPAEATARDREGRATPKREGEEDEKNA